MQIPENERIKELKLLKSSFEMYEKSKKDTERMMKQKMNADGSPFYTPEKIREKLELIQGMQDDVVEQFKMLGGNMEELKKPSRRRNQKTPTVMDLIRDSEAPVQSVPEPVQSVPDVQNTFQGQVMEVHEPAKETPTTNEQQQVPAGVVYDVIPLPSGGECYPNKMGKVKVAYLTAYDENILVSPNLYRDNKVLDEILKNKLINCQITPDNLLQGDRDAIILWLRATGYGNDFPITATDNESGKNFDATIDLSKIKFKPFNLKGDEVGEFDFTTPVTKDKIKFRFLTSGDNEYLDKVNDEEKQKAAIGKLEEMAKEISTYIENDKVLNRDEKKKVYEAQNAINMWKDKLVDSGEVDVPYTNIITNRMQMMIREINGNRDRKFIYNYIMNMNVRDASSFRKYVNENEPGLDFNLEVERPESLGGGTVSVFLQLDQYLFLNIAD